jgi:hypothetical protein
VRRQQRLNGAVELLKSIGSQGGLECGHLIENGGVLLRLESF